MNDNAYSHVLIGLDLTGMDDAIFSYLPGLLRALPVKRLFFVHVARQLELPEEIIQKFPDLVAPLDETIAHEITEKVEKVLSTVDQEVDFDVIVQEGTPLEVLLRTARIKNIDLMVMGRKHTLEGSGILAGHVIQKSPTSMLLIPENFRNGLKKLLLPVDFSRHSQAAFQLAALIQERTGVEIEFSHAYRLPSGYYKTGKSHDEFDEIMRSHAASDFKRFCKENSMTGNPTCHYILAGDKPFSKVIYDQAKASDADLILIGSRGRTRTSALLLGSIVEKLVYEDSDIPVLVVKNKGENMTFFEALMKI